MPDRVLFAAFGGILGLLVGSFLNVCIYRIPRDLSVVWPRSFCPECGHGIAWYDNIPLLSFFLLRGKCRHCGKAIGLRYPAVELLTCILFAAVVWQYGPGLAAIKWALFEAALIVLFWTDLEERILPDELTLGGTVVGLVLAAFVPVRDTLGDLLFGNLRPVMRSLLNAALAALVLAVSLAATEAVYKRVRKAFLRMYAKIRKRVLDDPEKVFLGAGDIKLLLFVGVFLGFGRGVVALLIGSLLGSIVGAIYIRASRLAFGAYELPLGSFLCIGAAVMPFLGISW